ncbi:MAG: hypothetical protein KGJ55_10890, partial [Gammaproteobacteria bacterium]|nr:hypothetical protein [Gammaproteobacteria bacterium]
MFQISTVIKSLTIGAMVSVILAAAIVGQARAANPLFEVDGAEEYNVPVPAPDQGINVFLQDAFYNINDKQFTATGGSDTNSIPISHTLVGVSRYAHLFSFKGLPKVGFWMEGLLPEITVYGQGFSVSGIGDPLFNFAAYYRPIPNLIIGNQNIISIPAGSTEVSNHFFTFF